MKTKQTLLAVIMMCAAGKVFPQKPFVPSSRALVSVKTRKAVSGGDRLSFYTGQAFETIFWTAHGTASFKPGKDNKILNARLTPQIKTLSDLLAGKPGAEEFSSAVKRFRESGKIDEFWTAVENVKKNYKASLTSERQWFFETGALVAAVQINVGQKNAFFAVIIDDDVRQTIESVPNDVPPAIPAASKRLIPIITAMKKSGTETDEKSFAAARNQADRILRSVGKLTAADR